MAQKPSDSCDAWIVIKLLLSTPNSVLLWRHVTLRMGMSISHHCSQLENTYDTTVFPNPLLSKERVPR